MWRYLESERLILRRFKSEDWADLHEYLSNPEVVFYEPYDIYTEEACKEETRLRFEEGEEGSFWGICRRDDDKIIGQIYFNKEEPSDFNTWELGYILNPKYQGKGYATEACNAIIGYAFETMNAHRIVAYCNVKNEPSWKLLERINIRREAHMLQNVYFKMTDQGEPIWHDSYMYAILKSEWINNK